MGYLLTPVRTWRCIVPNGRWCMNEGNYFEGGPSSTVEWLSESWFGGTTKKSQGRFCAGQYSNRKATRWQVVRVTAWAKVHENSSKYRVAEFVCDVCRVAKDVAIAIAVWSCNGSLRDCFLDFQENVGGLITAEVESIQSYNINCFMWVWNLVCRFTRTAQVEDVAQWGVP